MSGFDNEVLYADNWDFRGVTPVVGQAVLSGELPIGTGGSPAISVGKIVSPNETIKVGYRSPDITIDLADIGPATETLTGNTGVATPIANNINVVTANSTATFVGSAGNLTLDFGLPNLFIGTNGSTITSGGTNTSTGQLSMLAITSGSSNTSYGYNSQTNLTIGTANTSIGKNCLTLLVSGINNTCVGVNAGNAYTTNESNNILIGSSITGTVGESNTIRIGQSGSGGSQQNRCFVGGIDGVNVGSVAKVLTMASDQLGTATITSGAGITVTPAANTITIAVDGAAVGKTITGDSGGALSPTTGNWNIYGRSGSKTSGSVSTLTVQSPPYTDQAGSTTVTLNSGSFATAAITLTLPASAGLLDGDLFEFVCTTANALIIQSVGAQKIRLGSAITGAAGSLTSTAIGDSVSLRFRAADGFFYATSSMGNWTVSP
jgi:hypothetical protein